VNRRCLPSGRLWRRRLVDGRLVEGRLSDRGLRSRSLVLGDVLRRRYRCGPLVRWRLLYRCRWAVLRFRCRRLRNGVVLVR